MRHSQCILISAILCFVCVAGNDMRDLYLKVLLNNQVLFHYLIINLVTISLGSLCKC